jgi:hypothetical protein
MSVAFIINQSAMLSTGFQIFNKLHKKKIQITGCFIKIRVNGVNFAAGKTPPDAFERLNGVNILYPGNLLYLWRLLSNFLVRTSGRRTD